MNSRREFTTLKDTTPAIIVIFVVVLITAFLGTVQGLGAGTPKSEAADTVREGDLPVSTLPAPATSDSTLPPEVYKFTDGPVTCYVYEKRLMSCVR